MMDVDLDFLFKHVNQFEVRLDRYFSPNLLDKDDGKKASDQLPRDVKKVGYPAFQDIPDFPEPKICAWAFMGRDEVSELMSLENLSDARRALEKRLCNSYPKGFPKMILTELMYSTLKFVKTANFREEVSATVLSLVYLTHRYFSISYATTAEDVFYYFKDLLQCHSLNYPPKYTKIFSPDEAHRTINFFCKLYLRHLPIIRLLSLPNFNFELSLNVPPAPEMPPLRKKGKDKKGGKDKNDKKGKEKKDKKSSKKKK